MSRFDARADFAVSSDDQGNGRDLGNQKVTSLAIVDTGGVWAQDVAADTTDLELPFPGLTDAQAIFIKTERAVPPADPDNPDPLPTISVKLKGTGGEATELRADDNEIGLFFATVKGVGSLHVTNPDPLTAPPVAMRITWGAAGST